MVKRKKKPLCIIVSYYPGFQDRVLSGLQYGFQKYLENEREKLEGPVMPPEKQEVS